MHTRSYIFNYFNQSRVVRRNIFFVTTIIIKEHPLPLPDNGRGQGGLLSYHEFLAVDEIYSRCEASVEVLALKHMDGTRQLTGRGMDEYIRLVC